MEAAQIVIIDALSSQLDELAASDPRIRKLFDMQKRFMSLYPYYSSLGRRKLVNVRDQYGNDLEEVRLNSYWRIVFVARDNGKRIIWLKICDHDEIARNSRLNIPGHPGIL
jgi:hypothetical protein